MQTFHELKNYKDLIPDKKVTDKQKKTIKLILVIIIATIIFIACL